MKPHEKVAITGGHFAPAQALIEAYQKKGDTSIIFLGRRHAFISKKDTTLEYRTFSILPEVTFYPIHTGRFRFVEIALIISGFVQSFFVLLREKPDKLISFGGYLAVPAVIAAWLLRISVYLHEQTIRPGKANQFCAHFAKKVFTAFPEAVAFFDKNKTICIGNPIRESVLDSHKPDYVPKTTKPIVLILGGSTGSHSINILIEKNLEKLSTHFTLIHQIGDSEYGDYERLAPQISAHYIPVRFISSSELGYLYKHASFVISRSGANTFFDLVQFQLPALLIPLPWSARDEQLRHAEILEGYGVAHLFHQNQTNELFLENVTKMKEDHLTMKHNYDKLESYKKLIITGSDLLKAL